MTIHCRPKPSTTFRQYTSAYPFSDLIQNYPSSIRCLTKQRLLPNHTNYISLWMWTWIMMTATHMIGRNCRRCHILMIILSIYKLTPWIFYSSIRYLHIIQYSKIKHLEDNVNITLIIGTNEKLFFDLRNY